MPPKNLQEAMKPGGLYFLDFGLTKIENNTVCENFVTK